MQRSRSRPAPLLRKALLRVNDAACRLPGLSAHDQSVCAAVSDAYSGSRLPDVLAYDRLGSQHYLRVAGEVLDGLDLDGRTVLDIGCGVGMLSGQLLAAGASEVICLDQCPAMLDQCRERLAESGFPSGVCTFIQGEAASVPLPDSSVDIIVSSLMLGLLPHPERIGSELMRVLRPGGQISLAAQGARYLAELQDATIRYVPLRFQIGRPAAFWPMSSREAHRFCAHAGLGDISVKHAYWQETFDNPDEAFAFTAVAGATLWPAAIPDHAFGAIKERIRLHFINRRILKLTQDVVYMRARKPAITGG